MEQLEVLAARCEAATGPDRELDVEIHEAFGLPFEMEYWSEADTKPQRNLSKVPSYTRSLDAAMRLVPEEWLVVDLSEIAGDGVAYCKLGNPFHNLVAEGVAQEMHLALCAAALRARAASPSADTSIAGDGNE